MKRGDVVNGMENWGINVAKSRAHELFDGLAVPEGSPWSAFQ